MRRRVRLTESDLHGIIRETVNRILNEDAYSYNGEEYRQKMLEPYTAEIEREENYKQNMKRFQQEYYEVLKEYSIVKSLKRKPAIKYEAQQVFSVKSFLDFVKEGEGDTLYEKIWEKYGGEYGDIADQYLYQNVQSFKQK